MPRVQTKKKNKAGKPYDCGSCSEKIKAGQEYYEWSFRYGGTHRQHVSHGRPKQSQLTQSKMSGAYAAVEAAEESIASAECVEDIRSALEECAGEIESVKDEYQDGLDGMFSQDGAVAQEVQEKIDALESFKDELDSAASDLEDFNEDEPEEPQIAEHTDLSEEDFNVLRTAWETEHSEWEEHQADHLEKQRSAASDALGNLSI